MSRVVIAGGSGPLGAALAAADRVAARPSR